MNSFFRSIRKQESTLENFAFFYYHPINQFSLTWHASVLLFPVYVWVWVYV